MSLYKRGKTWWIRLSHQGEDIRRSTGTDDKKAAQRFHDELKAELWSRRKSGKWLSDALALWLSAVERDNREKSAIRQLMKLYPDRPLDQVTGFDIAQALSDKSDSVANRTGNIIRAALMMAHKAGWCDEIVIQRKAHPIKRLRWLTREEWSRLYAELPPHLKAPALFAVSTGLRQANVLGLRWDQVDMDRRIAWVHADEMKAGKAISIPLSQAAIEALQCVKGQHPIYCFTYRKKPLESVKRAFGNAKKKAEVDCTWHDLRHTWASWHVQNGTPLAVLKELGGWASMDMVMRYAHLSQTHIAEWAENAQKTAHSTLEAP